MRLRRAEWQPVRGSSSCRGRQRVKAKGGRGDPRVGEIGDVLGQNVARVALRLENSRQRLRPFAIGDERHGRNSIRTFDKDPVALKLFEGDGPLTTRAPDRGLGLKKGQCEFGASPFALGLSKGDWSPISVQERKWYGESESREQSRKAGITPFYT